MRAQTGSGPGRDIYTVSRLNREAKQLLETRFPRLWIEGEVSNLSRPASGHLYFCLKDAQTQIRCALFRMQARQLRAPLENGRRVLVHAQVSLYEGRGDFQLIVEQVEEAGEGALRLAFEALKTRLAAEGLFDAARKRRLPTLPRRIGVLTSPSGAVLHDILTTLRRRFPAIPVLLYPIPVQGDGAAARIAATIACASQHGDCDVLILARGGGSLEDLWAFNEEIVARALFHCAIPVISGIGHETDFTIADLVADLRAPTPTAAAELLSPDRAEWLARFARHERQLVHAMLRALERRGQRLDVATARLLRPSDRLSGLEQRLTGLARRLQRGIQEALTRRKSGALLLQARLHHGSPQRRLEHVRLRFQPQPQRLRAAMTMVLARTQEHLRHDASRLHLLSPLATLGRGYSIVQRDRDGQVVRAPEDVTAGELLWATLARGQLRCRCEPERPLTDAGSDQTD